MTSAKGSRTSIADRLYAALLSSPFFNAGIVICASFVARRPVRLSALLHGIYATTGLGALFLLAVPAVVGLVGGSAGTAKVLGHVFWTHAPSDRNVLFTLLIWAVIVAFFMLVLSTSHDH